MFEGIQKSIAGWQMGISYLGEKAGEALGFGGLKGDTGIPGVSKTQIGESLIGAGYGAARMRFAGIKAGKVAVAKPGERLVGVRYIPVPGSGGDAGYDLTPPGYQWAPGYGPAEDPGTPATVVEAIQKSIGESAEGWRMGFAHLGTKLGGVSADLKAGIEKSLAGWGIVGGEIKKGVGDIGSSVSGAFGDVGDWFKSARYQMLIPILLIVFVIVLVAIGYSGLGGPAARVAEREHARRR